MAERTLPRHLRGVGAQRLPGLATRWHAAEEDRAWRAHVHEEAQRLAAAHLTALLEIGASDAQWSQGPGTAAASNVARATVAAAIEAQGIVRLKPFYWLAWDRLCAEGGPFRLTPYAGVCVTTTRWDLIILERTEAIRAPFAAPLLTVRPPNLGHRSAGMLRTELGVLGSPVQPVQVWHSPYGPLSTNLEHLDDGVSEPPLWFCEGTSQPPSRPPAALLKACEEWWAKESAATRTDKGGVPSAASSRGSAQVLPASAKRRRDSISPQAASTLADSAAGGHRIVVPFLRYRATVVGGGVYVKESTIPNAGNGLFAAVPFASGAIVTAYDGERLHDYEHAASQEVQTHIVQMGGIYIDGLREPIAGRGGGSFANDNGRSRANVDKWLSPPEDGNRIYLRVKPGKTICCGEEIFLSYGLGHDVAMDEARME